MNLFLRSKGSSAVQIRWKLYVVYRSTAMCMMNNGVVGSVSRAMKLFNKWTKNCHLILNWWLVFRLINSFLSNTSLFTRWLWKNLDITNCVQGGYQKCAPTNTKIKECQVYWHDEDDLFWHIFTGNETWINYNGQESRPCSDAIQLDRNPKSYNWKIIPFIHKNMKCDDI